MTAIVCSKCEMHLEGGPPEMVLQRWRDHNATVHDLEASAAEMERIRRAIEYLFSIRWVVE